MTRAPAASGTRRQASSPTSAHAEHRSTRVADLPEAKSILAYLSMLAVACVWVSGCTRGEPPKTVQRSGAAAHALSVPCNCPCPPNPCRPNPPPLGDRYLSTPDFSSFGGGFFSSGLALADVNRDGIRDLVVASGNDLNIQPLTVSYGTRRSTFANTPDWQGGYLAHHLYLAAGDLGGSGKAADGNVDVAVAVFVGPQLDVPAGGAVVYRNTGSALEPRPSVVLTGFAGTSTALGDVDADGDLDLAVSSAFEGPGKLFDPHKPGRTRIYLNRNGDFGPAPDWISDVPTQAFGVRFADVDQDGWLDLVIGGARVQVFWGTVPSGPDRVSLSPTPWQSAAGRADRVSFIDVARLGARPGLSVVATDGCYSTPTCRGRLEAYAPSKTSLDGVPYWTSAPVDFPSQVHLADLTGDGRVDLLAGTWGAGEVGGPLRIYSGGDGDPPFQASPDFVSCTTAVGQQIDTADIDGHGARARDFELAVTGDRAVVTLPERNIQSIDRVTKNGTAISYAFSPSDDWISFAGGLRAGDVVRVAYRTSPDQDIAVANYNNYAPPIGNHVYLSNGPTTGKTGK